MSVSAVSASRRRRLWTVAVAVMLIGGALASAVVARSFDDGSTLTAAIEEAPLVQVADVTAAEGAPALGVYAQLTTTGHLCVWEAPSATSRQRGGGCNTVDDPLNGRPVSFTLSYDGGPATVDVRSATVFGLALSSVASVRVVMSDGSWRAVKLKKATIGSDEFRAFGYRFKKSDLKKGIGPIAVVSFDANGAEIGRQATGIG
jgi:hypothetical protein